MRGLPVIVDPRKGSGDACRAGKICGPQCLRPSLLQLGIPTEHEYLDYGDVQIIGRGPEDRPVLIGVEIKAISDLLTCMQDKRFTTNQLKGMLTSYEVRYLLIEGIITAAPNLELLHWKDDKMVRASRGEKPRTYAGVRGWIRTMTRAGMIEAGTADRRGTAAWIAAEYEWWSKPYEEHSSHLEVNLKSLENENTGNALDDLLVPEVSRKMLIAASFASNIGRKKAEAAARHFPTARMMANATPLQWMEIEGYGATLARTIAENLDRESER